MTDWNTVAMIGLREFTLDDVEPHNAGEDDGTVRWLTEGVASTPESTARWIERCRRVHSEAEPGAHAFAVEVDGRLAGMVALNPEPVEGSGPGDVNVSYAVHPWARGSGIATQAVRRAAEIAEGRGLGTTLLVRVDPRNKPSLAVVSRIGARYEGELTCADGSRLSVFRAPLCDIAQGGPTKGNGP